MEEAQRRSNRQPKLKKDDIYEYDEQVLKALSGDRMSLSETRQQCDTNESSTLGGKVQCSGEKLVVECAEVEIHPSVDDTLDKIERVLANGNMNNEISVESIVASNANLYSLNSNPLKQSASARADPNQNIGGEKVVKRISSTDHGILEESHLFQDIEGNFLSAGMSGTETD